MWDLCKVGGPEISAGVSGRVGIEREVIPMYTGRLIDELMLTVERTERQAYRYGDETPEPMMRAFPVWSTYMYEWPGTEQMIGVA